MKFRTKLLSVNCIPLVLLTVISLALGIMQFQTSLYTEREGNLRSTALAAMTLYSSQGYGDYSRRDDGKVWRGLNQNISEKTSIVDDLKRQTGVDITFFFDDAAAMTSISEKNGNRSIGLEANENIREYVLKQGKQLWCRNISLNGEPSQAYVIPIRQESDGSVAGALMASQSAAGFHAILRNYALTMVIPMLLILLAVFLFIRWHVDWFMQKFTEVSDRSRHDLLTGLYNKLTFENESKDYLAGKQPGDVAILLILDFDNFKHVNDHFGHQTGDAVLKAFADILVREFRVHDILGRVGGDEFMVLMRDMTEETVERADEMSGEILRMLRELKVGRAERFSCSIGIGTASGNCSFQELYQVADKALYEAKERGKACFVRHSSEETGN